LKFSQDFKLLLTVVYKLLGFLSDFLNVFLDLSGTYGIQLSSVNVDLSFYI